MAVTPDSSIYLCNTPLDKRYTYQVTFGSVSAQTSYFLGTAVRSISSASYQRKEGRIRAPYGIDQLWNVNYIMYQNSNYTNKYFYAFITRMEYHADSSTYIYFETDVWQTWQFNVSIKRSFVEREHQQQFSGGLPVLNTTNEGLDYGDSYDVVNTVQVDGESTRYWMIGSSISLILDAGSSSDPIVNSSKGGVFNGIASALDYYIIGGDYSDSLQTILNSLASKPWVMQGIYILSYIPQNALAGVTITRTTTDINRTTGEFAFDIGVVSENQSTPYTNINVGSIYNNLPDFTWGKLNFYPYSFIEITNYTGSNLIIEPQNIKNTSGSGLASNLQLIRGSIMHPEPRINYTVGNYNQGGESTGNESINESFTLDNFVQLPLQIDQQVLTLTNSAYQTQAQTLGAIGGAIVSGYGIATGNPGALIAGAQSLFSTALSVNAKERSAQVQAPGVIGNMKENPYLLSQYYTGIYVKWKTIKSEYRTRLEEWYNRYGQKVGINKVPSLFTYHNNFYYLKTNGAIVQGGIPQDDLIKIIQMFDNGVTMYSSPTLIGNV